MEQKRSAATPEAAKPLDALRQDVIDAVKWLLKAEKDMEGEFFVPDYTSLDEALAAYGGAGKSLDALYEHWIELASNCWGAECDEWPMSVLDFHQDMLAAHAEAAPAKPCYILGRTTIERVAEEGALNTEYVAFVAADELFHRNPYKRGAIVSCECGQALLDWWPDCHMCGKKNEAKPASGHGDPAPGLREAAEYAAQALERVQEWVQTSEHGKYFTVSYQGNLQRLREAIAGYGVADEWTARMDEHGILCRECQHLPNGEMTYRCTRRLELESHASRAALTTPEKKS